MNCFPVAACASSFQMNNANKSTLTFKGMNHAFTLLACLSSYLITYDSVKTSYL